MLYDQVEEWVAVLHTHNTHIQYSGIHSEIVGEPAGVVWTDVAHLCTGYMTVCCYKTGGNEKISTQGKNPATI